MPGFPGAGLELGRRADRDGRKGLTQGQRVNSLPVGEGAAGLSTEPGGESGKWGA